MLTQTATTQATMSPEQAIELLVAGNRRFASGKPTPRDLVSQVAATSNGQFPFAIILGCVDSRVPPEVVFDQGIGDVFSARIAGNFVNEDIVGSMEFACKVAGAKLIVVLGHSQCGAVKGACDKVELGNLTATLSNLVPAVQAVEAMGVMVSSDDASVVQQVAETNVEMTIGKIRRASPLLDQMINDGEVGLVGAMYDIGTGIAEFRPGDES